MSNKKIIVEYLYLDLNTCERCIGTDNILDDVMRVLTPALRLAGFTVEYNKIEIITAEIAIQHQFLSSPTIRVNGHDICQSVNENSCGCCSQISDTAVECRVFEYNGETFEVPPKEMLAKGILQAVFGQSGGGCSCDRYELPENLKKFFDGKKNKNGKTPPCCYGDSCDTFAKAKAEGPKTEGASVKVLGSGCVKCNQLEAATKAALEQMGMDTTIDHVTDFAQIAAYGVMTTPALVVDGKVVSYGKVLKTDEVIKILQRIRG
jgi:small redox-active disulfide protein 2